MRGVMTGAPIVERFGAPAAGHLPQGSLVMIEAGVETIVHLRRRRGGACDRARARSCCSPRRARRWAYLAAGAHSATLPRAVASRSPSRSIPRSAPGYASIANWPGQNIRGQLHVRLSRPRAGTARVTLSIGERRFDLVAGDSDAWAPDARTDAAIVAAMRSGRSMSVEALGRDGAPFADTYALIGRRHRDRRRRLGLPPLGLAAHPGLCQLADTPEKEDAMSLIALLLFAAADCARRNTATARAAQGRLQRCRPRGVRFLDRRLGCLCNRVARHDRAQPDRKDRRLRDQRDL